MRQLRKWHPAALAAGLALVLLGGMLTSVLAGGAARAGTAVSHGSAGRGGAPSHHAVHATAGRHLVHAAAAADPPVLAMSSSVSPNPMVVGSPATYTVTVRNTGSPATGTVTTTLPFSGGALTFGTLPAGCVVTDAVNQVVTCTAASIAAGGSVTYTIPVTLSPSLGDGVNIALRGTASASGVSAASTQLITQAFVSVDVGITKTGPATVASGGAITYTVTVENFGPSDAPTVAWQDPANGNLTTITSWPCGNTGLTVSCNNVGRLHPGDVRTYTITLTVKAGVPNGTVIPNCAFLNDTGFVDSNPDNNQSCINTTVASATVPASNITITKTAPDTVVAGGTVDYSVSVTNNGPDPATNVVVSDPIHVSFDSVAGLSAGCSLAVATVSCTAATLGVGETKTYSYSVQLDPAVPAGTVINNCAAATSTTTAITADPNPFCVQTTVLAPPMAQLEVSKNGPATAGPGDTFSYTLTVTNQGPDDATDVVVTDPVDTSLVTVTDVPGGCTVAGGTVTCPVGNLAAGDSRTFTITVQADSDLAPGTVIRNCDASASSTANPDPDLTSACVNTYIDPPVPVAEVEVVKSGPATAHAGDTISYTLKATNNGPDTATDVAVKDPLDTGVVTPVTLPGECHIPASTVVCDAGTLAVGETKTFTITVLVAGGLASGTQIDDCGQATSVSSILIPVPQGECITTVIVPPLSADVSVTKTGPPTVTPGGAIGYTLTVTNNGPDDADNVTVIDPVNLGLVTITSLPPGCTEAAGTVTCLVGTLASGASRSFTIDVSVNPGIEGLEISNCAHAYTTTQDPSQINNLFCVNTDVSNGSTSPLNAVIEVVKHGPATANADGTLSYTVQVTNQGPAAASNVEITDPIQPALVSVVSIPNDCVLNGGTLVCLPGSLAVGQVKTFTFTVHVAAGTAAGAQISNCATVGSETVAVREAPNPACTQTVVLPAEQGHLVITKTAPATVRPGGIIRYGVTLTNSGPDAAQDVVVKDPVQDPSLIAITSLPPVCSLAGITVTCTLPSLAAGDTGHFNAEIRVRDTAPDGTVLGNCIAVYSATADIDPDLDDIQSCVSTVVQRKADVRVVKTGPATARAGDVIGYTIAATNHGPDTAGDVVITDPVDESLVTVQTLPQQCTLAHGTITCKAGTLANGQSATFRFTVKIRSGVKTGTLLTNCAIATSSAALQPMARRSCTTATLTGKPFVPVTG